MALLALPAFICIQVSLFCAMRFALRLCYKRFTAADTEEFVCALLCDTFDLVVQLFFCLQRFQETS